MSQAFHPSSLTIMTVVVLDAVFKDPHYRLHPIRIIGDLVVKGERFCRKLPFGPKIQGLFLVVGVELCTVLSVLLLLVLFSNLRLQWLVVLFLGYSALAGGALWKEIDRIGEAVAWGDLERARTMLSLLVTRDTSNMGKSEILKTAIESLAENTSDGIVAPLLFFSLGGIPLVLFYKAADILDSMIGYRTPRYIQFGWGPAKLDDLLNFAPARLTAFLVAVSGWILGMDPRKIYETIKRFSKNSPSPNSGYPEAAFAGALGVQLGGSRCFYFNESVLLLPIGRGRTLFTSKDLFLAVDLSKAVTVVALFIIATLVSVF